MDASAAKRRWFWPTPAWLVWGAAAATGVLFACERWRWFPVHYQKGFPVLLAVAVVAAVLVLILACTLAALVFRRRVQFGLRTLLVFVTLCSLACSWLAVRIKQARRQAEAVAAIQEKGVGFVLYDWQLHKMSSRPPGLLWMVLGVDFFRDVELMGISDSELTNAKLAYLTGFMGLTSLDVEGESITDVELSHLAGLRNLRELRLVNTKVTEEGAKKLKQLLPTCKISVSHVNWDEIYATLTAHSRQAAR